MRLTERWGRFMIAGAAAIAVAMAMAGGAAARPAAQQAFRLQQIKHVWVIELENEGFTQSFGHPAADPYLARTLPGEGALLTNYFAIGHNSADNYIAQISGQAPNILTQEDCPVWVPLPDVTVSPYHQVLGPEGGCVFPASVPTLDSLALEHAPERPAQQARTRNFARISDQHSGSRGCAGTSM